MKELVIAYHKSMPREMGFITCSIWRWKSQNQFVNELNEQKCALFEGELSLHLEINDYVVMWMECW